MRHRLTLAVVLGLAACFGTIALSRTVDLGADARKPAPVDAKAIASRQAALRRAERSAAEALAARTPALPAVPEVGAMAVPVLPPIVIARRAPSRSAAAGPAGRTRAPARKRTPAPAAPARSDDDSGNEAVERQRERAREAAQQAAERLREAAKDGGG